MNCKGVVVLGSLLVGAHSESVSIVATRGAKRWVLLFISTVSGDRLPKKNKKGAGQ